MGKNGWSRGLLGALAVLLVLFTARAACAQQGTATVMMYMIGSDLETEAGCASSDIVEMAEAEFGPELNVLIQTGGSTDWAIEGVSGCQRYELRDGDIFLQEDLGSVSMMSAEAIGNFIRWGVQSYPADRYAIVFWDHGGGTMLGFGSDELDPDGMLMLGDLAEGLHLGGVHMDFVGFDACLMATLETALALAPYADYLIASEETEPGGGWMYTGWLELLGREPDADTEAIGRCIVEDYLSECQMNEDEGVTMALIDLGEIDAVYEAVRRCMAQAEEGMQNELREQIVVARSRARTYGEGEFEQVDVADFISRAQVDGAGDVLAALDRAVVCRGGDVADSCGLAMYHPYVYPGYYEMVSDEMRRIGINEDYFVYFNDFVSALVGGQSQSGGGFWLTAAQQETEQQNYTGTSWYNAQMADAAAQQSASLAQEELYLAEKGDQYVLSLSEEEWAIIAEIYMQVFVDDGEGYIDLGMDNVYEFDDDGDLLVDFDYTWIALDGQIVPFNAEAMDMREDGSWYAYGYVRATLNGAREIELMLCWDESSPQGYVAGYRDAHDGVGLPARQLLTLQPGDALDFCCDYYTYDGEYDGRYSFGEPLTVGNEQLAVSYEELTEVPTQVCFYLKDVYQRPYWTETIEFFFE